MHEKIQFSRKMTISTVEISTFANLQLSGIKLSSSAITIVMPSVGAPAEHWKKHSYFI